MLNERIRTLRLAKGLTLQAVADVFGISRASVSSWESGTNQPDPRKLEKLAELFDASVEYLITGKSTSDHEGLSSLGLLVPFIEWPKLQTHKSYKPQHFIPAWYSEPSSNAFATRLVVDDSFHWTPGPIPAGAIIIVDPMVKPDHGKFALATDQEGQIGIGEISRIKGNEIISFFNNRTTIKLKDSVAILGILTEWRLSGKL